MNPENVEFIKTVIAVLIAVVMFAMLMMLQGCSAQQGLQMELSKQDGTELVLDMGYEFSEGVDLERRPDGTLLIKAGPTTVNEAESGAMLMMVQMIMGMLERMYGIPIVGDTE